MQLKTYKLNNRVNVSNCLLTDSEIHNVFNIVIPHYIHKQLAIVEAKQKQLDTLDKFGTFQDVVVRNLNKKRLWKVIPSTRAFVWKGFST